ncbi:MAG: glycosyltransferase family 4 protein [Cyclobacteriaceae bacterium]|nr:glycosyltransferase family 4 protein [Cyclobacteriaceae bacterium]
MRALNVLLITQEDYLAGSTFSVSYLAKGLQQRGHKVVVVARPDSLLQKQVAGTGVVFKPLVIRSRFDWKAIGQLKTIVLKFGIQIVNAQSSKDRYVSVLARWVFRLPVLVIHTRRQVAQSIGGFLQYLFYVNGTDRIVAVSHGVKKSLVRKGIPQNHVQVIFNGTPREKYQLSQQVTENLKSKLKITASDVVVGCVSRRKNQEQLLLSLNYLSFPVTVIFVGIAEDDELRALRKQLILPHKLHYAGEVPGAEVLHYFKLFSCMVLCSVIEGLSQSLLEAMYLGVPVIATAAAGNLDLIEHQKNGLLYSDKDYAGLALQIQSALNNPALRSTIISGGITTASDTFSIDRTLQQYEEFYAHLLSSRQF